MFNVNVNRPLIEMDVRTGTGASEVERSSSQVECESPAAELLVTTVECAAPQRTRVLQILIERLLHRTSGTVQPILLGSATSIYIFSTVLHFEGISGAYNSFFYI